MSGKLLLVLQAKWRDEALRIRENRGFPKLKDLVDFIERRAEAANGPMFGRIGETSKSGRKYPRGGRQTLHPVPTGAVDSKVMTMATKVSTVYVRNILLVNASHHSDANNVSNLTIPCCTKQQKTKRVQL